MSCRRQKNFFWEEKGLLEPQIRVPEVVAGSGGIVNSPPGQKGHQREIKADQTGHRKEPKVNQEEHGDTPMGVVREIAADNGDIVESGDVVDSQVEDRVARDKMINDKNVDKHKEMDKFAEIGETSEKDADMYTDRLNEMYLEKIKEMDKFVETGEISEEEKLNEMYFKKFREIEEKEIGHPTSYGGVTHFVCGGKTSVEVVAEMKHAYETYARKELSIDDLFEMDAIFEMLHREEISEKDAEMKLEKLLTKKNEKKKLEAPKNTRIHETKTGKEIVSNRSKTTKLSHDPGRIEHSEGNMTEAARLQEARSVLKIAKTKDNRQGRGNSIKPRTC